MYTSIYLYIFLVFIMWVITINIIRIHLQRNARANGSYSYYIEFRLLSYNDGLIYGETSSTSRYSLIDNARKWEKFVRDHVGQWARLDYDVVYRGILFLSMTSEIQDINIIEKRNQN